MLRFNRIRKILSVRMWPDEERNRQWEKSVSFKVIYRY